jgi:hypothetical protein
MSTEKSDKPQAPDPKLFSDLRRVALSLNWYNGGRDGAKATVRLQVEHYYWRLFEEVNPKSDSLEDKMMATMQTIVWGGLCIEALLNETCRNFLRWLAKPREGWTDVWDTLERSSTQDKFIMLAKLCKRRPSAIVLLRRRVSQLIGLRNRLVHFKDSPTPVGEITFEETNLETLLGLPPTEIEKTLLDHDLVRRFQWNVRGLHRWLKKTDRFMYRL